MGRPLFVFPPLPVEIAWKREPAGGGLRGVFRKILGLDKLWPEYTLLRDWRCQVYNRIFTIPKGFVCDGASIPRLRSVRAIASLFSLGQVRTLPAGILHDWLYTLPDHMRGYPNVRYEESCLTRWHADELMRLVMGHFSVGVIGRWGAWLLVRMFGRNRYRAQ